MTFFSRKHLRLLLLPALLLLTGCAGSAKETADSTENEKLSAVATIFPQYDFLRAIGGEHLEHHKLHSPRAKKLPKNREPPQKTYSATSKEKMVR